MVYQAGGFGTVNTILPDLSDTVSANFSKFFIFFIEFPRAALCSVSITAELLYAECGENMQGKRNFEQK